MKNTFYTVKSTDSTLKNTFYSVKSTDSARYYTFSQGVAIGLGYIGLSARGAAMKNVCDKTKAPR
jgi:hypothetical protein